MHHLCLGEYSQNNGIDLCYFILATDHTHYCYQDNYSPDTADFDFRRNQKYIAGKRLQYKTIKPYGEDLSLKQNYTFVWDEINELYFLKLKV